MQLAMMASRERKWTSSGSAQPRSRLPSAAVRRPGDNEQGQWARPPSAMRPPSARPDSRLNSRPVSRLADSRPVSRQELSRPKSGVRPLSGKVFMRRTADHGWVAKAYNDPISVHSQPDLDLFDDLSDCESLDSFFDDDFDAQTSEEKLGNLLSCNTLGVESKGKRADWVSGKLGLPEFHCPRCRDHWYGITDVPCDEELARLIREGLWHTGKGDGGKSHKGVRRGRVNKRGEDEKDYRSHSSITLSSESSSARLNRGADDEVKGQRGSSIANEDQKQKKSKRRITFKLDNEHENSGSSDHSNTQLDEYGGYRRAKGSKEFGDGLLLGDGQSGNSISVGRGEHGARKSGDGINGADGDSRVRGRDGSKEKKRKGRGRRSDSFSDDSEGSGLLDGTRGRGQQRNGAERKNETQLGNMNSINGGEGTKQGEVSNKLSSGALNYQDAGGNGVGNGEWNGQNKTATSLSHRYGDQESNNLTNESNQNPSTTNGLNASMNLMGDGNKQKNGAKDTTSSSLGSSSQVRQTGSRRGSLAGEDHGKNVRKAGGYMRAVSPSSSEWGDPTHARPFISSTATSRTVSRCGSAVNLSGRLGDEQGESGRVTLPPIVPAITNKKPLFDLSDLTDGLQFTRAWTFSYHK